MADQVTTSVAVWSSDAFNISGAKKQKGGVALCRVMQFDGVSQSWGRLRFNLLAGFGLPHILCCCRNHESVETAYAEAGMHILRSKGEHRVQECLPIDIPRVPPGTLMRI